MASIYIHTWKGLLVIFIAAFFVALIVSGLALDIVPDKGDENQRILAVQHKAELTINFGNGTIRKFDGEIAEGMTVFNVLEFAGYGNFDFELSGAPGFQKISSIDGMKSTPAGKQWKVYVNGKEQNASIDAIPVSGKDKIELRYQ